MLKLKYVHDSLRVSESEPRLQMDPSHVALGDLVNVTLTCFITYHSQLKVTLTLTEASRTFDTIASSPIEGDTRTLSATVRAKKPRFGPFRCLAVFTQPNSTNDELAKNSVELRSNVIEALQPARTF